MQFAGLAHGLFCGFRELAGYPSLVFWPHYQMATYDWGLIEGDLYRFELPFLQADRVQLQVIV